MTGPDAPALEPCLNTVIPGSAPNVPIGIGRKESHLAVQASFTRSNETPRCTRGDKREPLPNPEMRAFVGISAANFEPVIPRSAADEESRSAVQASLTKAMRPLATLGVTEGNRCRILINGCSERS